MVFCGDLLKVIIQMMTFLVFDRDVLFIPCYSFFLLSDRPIAVITQKLPIASTSNFLYLFTTSIRHAVRNFSDFDGDLDE